MIFLFFDYSCVSRIEVSLLKGWSWKTDMEQNQDRVRGNNGNRFYCRPTVIAIIMMYIHTVSTFYLRLLLCDLLCQGVYTLQRLHTASSVDHD